MASYNNHVKCLVELNGSIQFIDEDGIVHTSAGRKLGWDKEAQVWREGFTIQDGHLMRWEKGAYVIYGTRELSSLAVDELVAMDKYDFIAIKNRQLVAYLDPEWHVIAAYQGELVFGWQVNRYDAATRALVPTGETYFDYMVRTSGHDTIAVEADRSPGLGISITLNEKALGADYRMTWRNQGLFIRYWQEVALARMQADGNLPEDMTYNQFVEWLKAGNKITLKELSAWNPQTGQVEIFKNIPVTEIGVYDTLMNQASVGEPALPMTGGKTRYSTDNTTTWWL